MDSTEHTPRLSDPCPDKTRADLEWDRLLAALAERAHSPYGKRIARTLGFGMTYDEVKTRLGEVKEAVDLDRLGERLPAPEVAEVGHALDRTRIGASLGNEDLRAIGRCLTEAGSLRRFLAARKHRLPLLMRACSSDPSLDALEREVNGAFDPDGTLSDRASPRLAEYRNERRHLRERLIRRLEEVMQKYAEILQDTYFTERDGRYVLPVRADAHERFPGIVHATSGSGATLFVEPRVVVDMGNRLKVVEALVTHEEELVYAALSGKIGDEIDAVTTAVDALALADVRAASARLARDLQLTFPTIPTEPSIRLLGGRHPLLALDGVVVVPSDIDVSAGHAMIVSGPNAGGKTVALKTLGLAALALRAGLPVPADEGSSVAVFEAVLTDVGDDQNLHKNLSTFSAHVQNLGRILSDTRPGTLVLLDELAGGTDPREGEALASAVLDSLCLRGGAVATTTHYEGLKALALADPRFVNASVGFDMATMSPTFQLSMGIPGASSALAVARRFGIPNTVLERAERFLSHEALSFEEMVAKLQAERHALSLAREAAEREAKAAAEKTRALDQEITRLRAEERAVLTEAGKELMDAIRRARQNVRDAEARLRTKPTVDELRAASRAIDAVAQKTTTFGELEPAARNESASRAALTTNEIRVGSRVYVPRLRAEADVVEILPGGQLRVAAGPLKLMTNIAEIRAPEGGASGKTGGGAGKKKLDFDAASDPDVPIQTSDNTADLRGLRAHEALGMAEQFLDRSLGAGRRVAFLIHGHGKGTLRDVVRDGLRQSPYVARLRPGEPREGGDGVTVVWLRV